MQLKMLLVAMQNCKRCIYNWTVFHSVFLKKWMLFSVAVNEAKRFTDNGFVAIDLAFLFLLIIVILCIVNKCIVLIKHILPGSFKCLLRIIT